MRLAVRARGASQDGGLVGMGFSTGDCLSSMSDTTGKCEALDVGWIRQRRERRRVYDLHELLCSTFPSPVVALDRECGDDYVDLLGDVDLIEASLAGALSWGREAHRPGLLTALEQAVSCQLTWDPIMTKTQRDALNGVVDALRALLRPRKA